MTQQMILLIIGIFALTPAEAQRQRKALPPQEPGNYTIEQACSDRAQLNTIAFDALGFLTGDLCSSTFLPPGKVSDHFGFQYMRDIDTGFCPERHGTYFGSFYMKDAPAMGRQNYSISTALTGDKGEAFLEALTQQQRTLITSLVDLQRADLGEIVQTRRAISVELRRFMNTDAADPKTVLALARRYGQLDGEMSWYYATCFSQVSRTLTAAQRQTLLKLRDLNEYPCFGAYLYSEPVPMPEIPNTDFLFGVGQK